MPEEAVTLCSRCQRLQAKVEALTQQLQEAQATVARLRPDYDMHDDNDGDKQRWPHLRDALNLCEQTLRRVFDDADRQAMKHQRWHKHIATAAALCGTLAVLCAIVHLARIFVSPWPDAAEVICVGVAFFAVILGLKLRFHKKWLIQRNKAERCRFLKFRFLIQHTLSCGDQNAMKVCEQELRNAVKQLSQLNNEKQLEHWASTDPLMELLSTHQQGPDAENVLPDLTAYYLEKRIRCQLDFLTPRIRRNKWQDQLTASWPFWLFFASIFFALFHFALNLSRFPNLGEYEETVARWIIVFAAGLPVVSAGVATWRAAHQFARNMKRYQHCHHALTQLRDHLHKADTPSALRFRDFVICESKLEAEHRNWLHLMTEAEWF